MNKLIEARSKLKESKNYQFRGSLLMGAPKKFYPLSPLQKGLLFHTDLGEVNRSTQVYINQVEIIFQEDVHLVQLSFAVKKLAEKYPLLKSFITPTTLKLEIDENLQLELVKHDYSQFSNELKILKYDDFIHSDLELGFDIQKPPLIRFNLIKFSKKYYKLVVTYHHVLMAGPCVLDILEFLIQTYDNAANPQLNWVPTEIINSFNLCDSASREKLKLAKQFLQENLGTIQETCFIYTQKKSSQKETHAQENFLINLNQLKQIRYYCKKQAITINLFLQLAWCFLLRWYTGQDKIIFGATRELPKKNTKNLSGFCINTIPTILSFNENTNVKECIDQLKKQFHLSSSSVYIPLTEVKSFTALPHESSLFETLFDYKTLSPNEYMKRHNSNWQKKQRTLNFNFTTNYLISLELFGLTNSLGGRITFRSDLYDQQHIRQLIKHYLTIIDHLLSMSIKTPTSLIHPYDAKEITDHTFSLKGADLVIGSKKSLIKNLQSQAAKQPAKTAVICEELQLTYKELDHLSDQIATWMRSNYHLSPQERIILRMKRNIYVVPVLLALIKLQVIFIPVDLDIPEERLKNIKEQSNAHYILNNESSISKITDCYFQTFLETTQLKKSAQVHLSENHEIDKKSVYILFTSGTTGKPKGVEVTYEALINVLIAFQKELHFEEKDSFLAISALTFDISYLELFLPLISGGMCVLATEQQVRSPKIIASLIENYCISTLQATPTYWRIFLNDTGIPLTLRKIISGGEPMPRDLVQLLSKPSKELWNAYGPTETTIWSTIQKMSQKERVDDLITIGKPINNTVIYILSSSKMFLPKGVIGEIYIGGTGLAKGYISETALTQNSFIEIQVPGGEIKRLYKTGDSGYIDFEDRLHYIGRLDEQIKLSGHRIELTEIENILRQHPSIREAAVKLFKEGQQSYLVGYYAAIKEIDSVEILNYLGEAIPHYMVPKIYVRLDQLPINAHGKIDKNNLLKPKNPDTLVEYLSPEEDLIARIWSQVLKIDKSSIKANSHFFQFGGNSIEALKVINKINDFFNIHLLVVDIFHYPTIRQLHQRVQTLKNKKQTLLPPIRSITQNSYPLSLQQQRLWTFYKLMGPQPAYNMFIAYELQGNLCLSALQKAIIEIIKRHSILRTTYCYTNSIPSQVIHDIDQFTLERETYDNNQGRDLHNIIKDFAQYSFDLEKDFPIKVKLLVINKNLTLFLMNIHHIACDGWSLRILKDDLNQFYYNYVHTRSLPSVNKLCYKDFASWQDQNFQKNYFDSQRLFWKEQLSRVATLSLPRCSFLNSNVNKGERIPFSLDHSLSKQIESLAIEKNSTSFLILFSLFAALMYRYTYQTDFMITTPTSGRHYSSTDQMVGFFVNLLPMCVHLADDMDIAALLDSIKTFFLEAMNHQDLPFEEMVKIFQSSGMTNDNPLLNILFVKQETFENDIQFENVIAKRISGENDHVLLADFDTAKFNLTFYFQETREGILGLVEYNINLFPRSFIETMITNFKSFLHHALHDFKRKIREIPFTLSDLTQQFVVIEDTIRYPYEYKNITAWFQAIAIKNPKRVALASTNKKITFQQLNEKAETLAAFISHYNLSTQYPIAICLTDAQDIIVAMLAILKKGYAYLPIDHNSPPSRINRLLEDSKASLLINSQHLKIKFNDILTIDITDCENKKAKIFNNCELVNTMAPSPLSYVMYTSGSTGKPKGVLVSHVNLLHLFNSCSKLFTWLENDVWSLLHSTAFDFSVWEIWGALLFGKTLAIPPEEIRLEPQLLIKWLIDYKVTVLNLTPSLFNFLLIEISKENELADRLGKTLRYVILGGESIHRANLALWFNTVIANRVELYNMYGITEATVHSTFHKVTKDDLYAPNNSNIGIPIPGIDLLIIDEKHRPVPTHIIGEIGITGNGISNGYLNDELLNTRKFLEFTNSEGKKIRLFKTGDLARKWHSGEIEFIGRKDDQVKIRGNRVGLTEIKNVALNHAAVQDAIVNLVQENNQNRIYLYLLIKKSNIAVRENDEFLQEWTKLYNEIYTSIHPLSSNELNTLGWQSSYTQKPIPQSEMLEWVENTLSRLLKLNSKYVLEIGCGTGLILFRLLPYIQQYLATDFSEKSIAIVQSQLKTHKLSDRVRLKQRPAHYFDPDEKKQYDLVIFNSVIQYFPNSYYFVDTLNQTIETVKEGGSIFIGDIRSLVHDDLFYASVALSQEVQLTELKSFIKKSRNLEEELLVDFNFFKQYALQNKRINYVKVELKQGKFQNEMNRFRFDVTLGIERPVKKEILNINWHDWGYVTLDLLSKNMVEDKFAFFAIKNIPNARFVENKEIFESIESNETYDAFYASKSILEPINPSELIILAEKYDYQVCLLFSYDYPKECFDLLFYKKHMEDEIETLFYIDRHQSHSSIINFDDYFNNPLSFYNNRKAYADIRAYIKQNLPIYMWPAKIFFVDQIPLTINGKVDDKKLQENAIFFQDQPKSFFSDEEKKLALIWQEILGMPVQSNEDDFFELGGNSLLAIKMLTQIENATGIKIRIKSFYNHRTLKQLSRFIANHQLENDFKKLGIQYQKNSDSPIITLHSEGKGIPLFLFHPVGGTVFAYLDLVKYLKPNRPIYAIQDPAVEYNKIIYDSIEEMVADYLRYIQIIQPAGPYLFAGSSMGGTLAYEAARQINKKQSCGNLVAMFDSWALYSDELADKHRLAQGLMRQYHLIQSRLQSIDIQNPEPWLNLHFRRLQLILKYQPSWLEDNIILYKSDILRPEFIPIEDASNYWSLYCGSSLRIVTASGDHETMMVEPQVMQLALSLDKEMTKMDELLYTTMQKVEHLAE